MDTARPKSKRCNTCRYWNKRKDSFMEGTCEKHQRRSLGLATCGQWEPGKNTKLTREEFLEILPRAVRAVAEGKRTVEAFRKWLLGYRLEITSNPIEVITIIVESLKSKESA